MYNPNIIRTFAVQFKTNYIMARTKKLKYYTVVDNSQQQCIDTDCSNHYLAGTFGGKGKTVKVLVQPFKMEYTFMKKKHIHTFIIGLDESTGLRHLIMFY